MYRYGAVFLILVALGECIARFALGLGSPPLSIVHPAIEYMFKPNQDVWRFGNHFVVNQYGMRSDPFPLRKAFAEVRVMVIGDSVVNGGNLTDQSDLATTLLRTKLAAAVTGTSVVVGNISAGSWGPGNWLAYAKEYGFFDADVIVLVISSHDYADNPEFKPLDPQTHPTERPISALLEGAERYLPRYLPHFIRSAEKTEVDPLSVTVSDQDIKTGLADLKSLLLLAQTVAPTVIVLQHWEKQEIESGQPAAGNVRIRKLCELLGVSVVSLEPAFHRKMDEGFSPFRDAIHPNSIGQKLIADSIYQSIPVSRLQFKSSSCIN